MNHIYFFETEKKAFFLSTYLLGVDFPVKVGFDFLIFVQVLHFGLSLFVHKKFDFTSHYKEISQYNLYNTSVNSNNKLVDTFFVSIYNELLNLPYLTRNVPPLGEKTTMIFPLKIIISFIR